MWEDEDAVILQDSPLLLPRAGPKQKTEGEHTTALIKGIQRGGGYAYKIPDPVGSFKTNPRPFDVIACVGGKSIAIECKWAKEPKAFGLGEFSETQQKSLTSHLKAGGVSLAVLFTKYDGRIILLSWRWEEFCPKGQSHKKKELLRRIGDGEAWKKERDVFPIDWLGAYLMPSL